MSEVSRPKRWIALLGKYEAIDGDLVFKGGVLQAEDQTPGFRVGNFLSDIDFGGGTLSVRITFIEHTTDAIAGVILYHEASSGGFIQTRFGGPSLCALQTFTGRGWTMHAAAGEASQLVPDRQYLFETSVAGSQVVISVDGVRVLDTKLPFALPSGPAGVWAGGRHDIRFSQFEVHGEAPLLFVVMQYTKQFNELYSDVIKQTAESMGFEVLRADEVSGPGLIIADVERDIIRARAIVADITPDEPNVFWEVGYAHALRKPIVLIAERDRKLPFDVSAFRTLFYDNTIGGKARIQKGLRKHLKAIQTQWPVS